MKPEIAFTLAAIVVSWVMFVFNFVLGYYIGRAVEAGEQLRLQKKKQEDKKKRTSAYRTTLIPTGRLLTAV